MLRDKTGWTPFATAMTHKDNKAAQAILDRAPNAADQVCVRSRSIQYIISVTSLIVYNAI